MKLFKYWFLFAAGLNFWTVYIRYDRGDEWYLVAMNLGIAVLMLWYAKKFHCIAAEMEASRK